MCFFFNATRSCSLCISRGTLTSALMAGNEFNPLSWEEEGGLHTHTHFPPLKHCTEEREDSRDNRWWQECILSLSCTTGTFPELSVFTVSPEWNVCKIWIQRWKKLFACSWPPVSWTTGMIVMSVALVFDTRYKSCTQRKQQSCTAFVPQVNTFFPWKCTFNWKEMSSQTPIWTYNTCSALKSPCD